ncbi:E3 ubiquitin/ISG15 ligase TRIM25-like [Discoglossus pictus]
MASADLTENLNCPICTDIYTNPTTLICGHTYCMDCITNTWDNQDDKDSTCPECRLRFRIRPELKRNMTLCKMVEKLHYVHLEQGETGILCTNCIHFPVPASKTCLHCEASLCDNHVMVHSKSEEHVLLEPTTSFDNRKCSIHKKLLEYYCYEDAVCICVSCSLSEKHKGHQVEMLSATAKKKKETWRYVLQKLNLKRKETEERTKRLQEYERDINEKAVGLIETVNTLFRGIREHLEVLEKRATSEISRQKEQILLPVLDLIRQLEKEKDKLSKKICDIEELCNMTDPLSVLHKQKSHNVDMCDAAVGGNEGSLRDNKHILDRGDLDEGLIAITIFRSLTDIVTDVKVNTGFYMQEASDILLDINTAGKNVDVSDDLKTATWSQMPLQRAETPERFRTYAQILSTKSFSSGRHYWEVETSESGNWRVGVCYPSVETRGDNSIIGHNYKSWCLRRFNGDVSMVHDSERIVLLPNPSYQRLAIYLDYEAGRLSFYELCDQVRHLHTFTATFTEPLHAAFNVYKAWVRIRS